MRRPEHDGQSPRVLHENGTARSRPQLAQTQRMNPRLRSPQARYFSNSKTTYFGSGRA